MVYAGWFQNIIDADAFEARELAQKARKSKTAKTTKTAKKLPTSKTLKKTIRAVNRNPQDFRRKVPAMMKMISNYFSSA